MGRPKKNESDLLSERIEFRGPVGTKELLEQIQKRHGKDSIGATIRFIADREAKRLKIELPKP